MRFETKRNLAMMAFGAYMGWALTAAARRYGQRVESPLERIARRVAEAIG